jgi:hypothetical protein
MHTTEDIELQIWEYIDGTCSLPDRERISILVSEDEQWASAYASLLELHSGIGSAQDLAEPSLRFTANVMDAIASVQPARVMTIRINKKIISGIAASFLVTVGALLAYIIYNANWKAPAFSGVQFPSAHYSDLLGHNTLNIALGAIVMLALALIDHALRMRRTQHH